MAFLVSPGVQVQEVDLTNVVPAVSTSIGAIAGEFRWGPVDQVVTLGSEKDLVKWFGKPNDTTAKHFFPAAQFLQYGQTLKVNRAVASDMYNAATTSGDVRIKNITDYESQLVSLTSDQFFAKYPGNLGNSILVSVCPADATAWTAWTYKSEFDSMPTTSSFVAGKGGSLDEMHIIVIDADGEITGTAGTVLEKFAYVSQATDAKTDDGATNFWVEVLKIQSQFVWGGAEAITGLTESQGTPAQGQAFTVVTAAITDTLTGGADGTTTAGEITTGYDIFGDTESIDINLLIGGVGDTTHSNALITLVEGRKDTMVFLSPELADTVNNATAADDVKAWADVITSSSYAVLDSSALYVYDKYNDKFRWIVANGTIAGLCANTDQVADSWFSPAGFNRGQLLGVTKLAFNPKQTERDTLYKARVNPLVSFPGQGTVLYGDKTALAKPSAFDRINVRRLFIVLEKAIATAAKYQLFEFNDEFTRAMFRNMVEPFMRDVKGRRGMTDFAVVCDETNNTAEVIDTNRFVADIYIKPSRSINFITLSFVATRTGVEFSEIVGR